MKPLIMQSHASRSLPKKFIAAICASALLATNSVAVAQSQNYPDRPVRMIVANGPGSAPDVVARLLAAKLSESFGQSVIVDNRPGATGLIAAELLANSAPDGQTIFLTTMTQLIAMLMYQRYMLASEFAAVSLVGTTPFAIAISASLPVKTMADWIAYAKARPGQLLFGSGGMWGSSHLCMETINAMAGLKLTHVPFANTTTTMTSLINGQIHIYCPAAPSMPAYLKSGKLRAIGVTYKKPTPLVPGVPPVSDTLPGFELLGWYGMIAPRNTPPQIISRISVEIAKALKSPELKERLFTVGADAVGSTPQEYAQFLKKDTDYWTKSLRESGAKLGSAGK